MKTFKFYILVIFALLVLPLYGGDHFPAKSSNNCVSIFSKFVKNISYNFKNAKNSIFKARSIINYPSKDYSLILEDLKREFDFKSDEIEVARQFVSYFDNRIENYIITRDTVLRMTRFFKLMEKIQIRPYEFSVEQIGDKYLSMATEMQGFLIENPHMFVNESSFDELVQHLTFDAIFKSDRSRKSWDFEYFKNNNLMVPMKVYGLNTKTVFDISDPYFNSLKNAIILK